jgi:8-oxo-dGTP pyrophosphatase MutT (NUDIX family)
MGKRAPIGVIKARGVIIHGNRIFLCKFDPTVYGGPVGSGFFGLPGGTLDPGETLKECLHREIVEELGIVGRIGPLVYSQEIIREEHTMFDFWYWIENAEDFLNVDLSQATHGFEHSEVGFYTLEEFETSGETYKPLSVKKLLATWIEKGPVFVEMGRE